MSSIQDGIPRRVRVLILGGGVHGAGIAHDMGSRGWQDVLLVEKDRLGSGTSSHSTKLIHGGLRYLKYPKDYPLVIEALAERKLLSELAPDLVRPLELLFPVVQGVGMPRYMVKTGLWLYDLLAGSRNFMRHTYLNQTEVTEKAPVLDVSRFKCVYSFWDGQTDDLALVRRVAASAEKSGVRLVEETRAVSIAPSADGYDVILERGGTRITVSARYVVNCLGPWANQFLEGSGLPPTHRAVNNKGSHLVFPDIGLKAGVFLQSQREDGRIFFLLPWQGYTLLGTTEVMFEGDPDRQAVDESEVRYLLENCNTYLRSPLTVSDIRSVFCGLRFLPVAAGRDLTSASRSYVIGERPSGRGIMYTIYGGKLTTYRTLAAAVGDRIVNHFGDSRPSRTHLPETWIEPAQAPTVPGIGQRFFKYESAV